MNAMGNSVKTADMLEESPSWSPIWKQDKRVNADELSLTPPRSKQFESGSIGAALFPFLVKSGNYNNQRNTHWVIG